MSSPSLLLHHATDAWQDPSLDTQLNLGVVVMGSSGDLAKKVTRWLLVFILRDVFHC